MSSRVLSFISESVAASNGWGKVIAIALTLR
jgi:hypothetical protein